MMNNRQCLKPFIDQYQICHENYEATSLLPGVLKLNIKSSDGVVLNHAICEVELGRLVPLA